MIDSKQSASWFKHSQFDHLFWIKTHALQQQRISDRRRLRAESHSAFTKERTQQHAVSPLKAFPTSCPFQVAGAGSWQAQDFHSQHRRKDRRVDHQPRSDCPWSLGWRETEPALGSGPRYQILSHVFGRCASQTTHGHARIARVSKKVWHKSYTSGHCLTSPIITTKEGPCTSRGSPQVKPWTTKKTAVNDVNDEKDGHEASDKYASTDPWWNLEIHPQGKGIVGLLSAREMEFWHGYSKTTVASDVLLYS